MSELMKAAGLDQNNYPPEVADFVRYHHNPVVTDKNREITRLHAEAAELRAQLTQSSQAMFDAGATLSAKREEVAALRADLARVTSERDAALAEVERVKQFIQGIADRENPEHYGNARDELHLVIKSCKELLDGPDPGYSALTPPAQQHTQGDTP